MKSTIAVRVAIRNKCCRRLMLGPSRRPEPRALKYRRNEFPADLAASGRDRPHCPRQFDSASNQLLTTRSTFFKHDGYKFSASHLYHKLCNKRHNFVPIYLPTPVQFYIVCSLEFVCVCGAVPISRRAPPLRPSASRWTSWRRWPAPAECLSTRARAGGVRSRPPRPPSTATGTTSNSTERTG